MRTLFFSLFFLLPPFLPAHAFELGMPLTCHYGKDCFIQNYFDDDPTDNALDYHHGHLTYNKHDGTDFRILTAISDHVDVIAAAPGVVKATRDGMEDINVNKIGKDTVMSKGCGNAVVLVHEDGYSTMYCHMRKGSVAVQKGMKVSKGQKLGEVGLSGLTEFPHVHLGVLYRGKHVDPFTGIDGTHPLWDKQTATLLAYIPSGAIESAFSASPLKPDEVRSLDFNSPTPNKSSPALILWTDMFGLQPGDTIQMAIHSPEGKTLAEQALPIDRYKAAFFYYIGKKNGGKDWPAGNYTGIVSLKREGKEFLEKRIPLVIK